MVNTRRTGGALANQSENLRSTRRRTFAAPAGSSSISESEESQPEDWNPAHRRECKNTRVRHPVKQSRSLGLYTSRKMRADSESSNSNYEEEIFSCRRNTHRLKRRASNLNRMERRTALSLRPISRKSYADPHSPLAFNSDEGTKTYPTRKRTVRFKNTSWLADDQMHKVGYPNLNSLIPYSEEDSRDAQENNDTTVEMRRSTRQRSSRIASKTRDSNNSKYSYKYDGSDRPERCQNSSMEWNSRELRSARNSNDKEKEDTLGLRRLRSQAPQQINEIVVKKEIDENEVDKIEIKEVPNDGNCDEKKEENNREDKRTSGSKASSDSDAPLTRRRDITNNSQFRLPPPRSRKDCSSSDSTDDAKQNRIRLRNKPITSENKSRPYSFRQRPPKQTDEPSRTDFSMPGTSRSHLRKRHLRRTRRSSSSSSSSSSEENMRYSKAPKSPHSKNEQRMKGKSVAGGGNIILIGPETLDGTVRFSSIGGLDNHILCLKEMVLLPMMYPEIFQQFHVKPPRGVLFHGPPGTGKTLIARALANECSFGKQKVSFFMRKGADLLSKWIGESEKQLRLLFEQASEMKPSIIFFDELDGLIPVRSSRNDQIHASIVSTLLALMDGLDDRGEIIVIGATNRIDAIDPAFRRPGRFDRELYFPLPARKEREEILNVHVSKWQNPPNSQLMSYLAEQAVGYCGSDLRALCTEAVIHSLRRTYPQVYNSEYKLLLKPEEVNVEKLDFMRAKSVLVPAAHRTSKSVGRKLPPILEPLLGDHIKNIFSMLEINFPHGVHEKLARIKISANIKPAQILLVGESCDHGQSRHLGPAVVYKMEHLHCYTLDLSTLYKESSRSTEEATLQVFTEARRNAPSVIYIPCIDKFWNVVSDTTKEILLDQLGQLDPHIPILLFATADVLFEELPDKVQKIFSIYRKEVFQIDPPTSEQRKNFFRPLIMDTPLTPMRCPRQKPSTPPPLPRAPTPPPLPLTEEELKKLYDKEEHTLRELRIFLRDMCRKLAQNKLFFMFTKPVDIEEVPDYPTIIKQPMDLETMMMKVDFHHYECAKDFLQDIEQIVHNALEYNPARTSVDKQIRHRACSLRDYAYTLIKTEMDSDFEDKCQEISKERKKRQNKVKFLPEYLMTPDISNQLNEPKEDENLDEKKEVQKAETIVNVAKPNTSRKRRTGSWQKGLLRSNKRRRKDKSSPEIDETPDKSSGDDSKENNPDLDTSQMDTTKEKDCNDKTLVNGYTELSVEVPSGSSVTTPTKADGPTMSARRRLSDFMSPSELLEDCLCFDDVDQAINEGIENPLNKIPIECPVQELKALLNEIVEHTEGYSLQSLLDLHTQISKIVKRFLRTHQRTGLAKELLKEFSRFKKEQNMDTSGDPCQSSTNLNVP